MHRKRNESGCMCVHHGAVTMSGPQSSKQVDGMRNCKDSIWRGAVFASAGAVGLPAGTKRSDHLKIVAVHHG